MNGKNQFVPDQDTRKKLASKLKINFNDYMQDWEYEISEPKRIEQFLHEYDGPKISNKEKETLMEIILDSLNDLLLNGQKLKFEENFKPVKER